jgi:hypothetical protein
VLVSFPLQFSNTPLSSLGRANVVPLSGVALAVLSEIVFALYFSAIGRDLGPGYPRRRIRAVRNRLSCLLCALGLCGFALALLAGSAHSEAATGGLVGVVSVAGCVSAYLFVASLYLSMSIHLRAVAEMWRDSRDDAAD